MVTKAEASQILGKSLRSLAVYASKGKLPVQYVSGKNGRQAYFDGADVERLKAEMEMPVHRAVPIAPAPAKQKSASAETALALAGELRGTSFSVPQLAAHLAALSRAFPPPVSWLTLSEAVIASGLPAAWLVARAREGASFALNVGQGSKAHWRFNREALAAVR
jgi:hypothetical protein